MQVSGRCGVAGEPGAEPQPAPPGPGMVGDAPARHPEEPQPVIGVRWHLVESPPRNAEDLGDDVIGLVLSDSPLNVAGDLLIASGVEVLEASRAVLAAALATHVVLRIRWVMHLHGRTGPRSVTSLEVAYRLQVICKMLQITCKSHLSMTAQTLGFAVQPEDRPLLDELTAYFGQGNRSAYLRATLRVMKSIMIADKLREAQAYGQQRTAEAGFDPAEVPARVQALLKSGAVSERE
jgi:hypothetical protein